MVYAGLTEANIIFIQHLNCIFFHQLKKLFYNLSCNLPSNVQEILHAYTFFKFFHYIYLFLALLGLRCCLGFSPVSGAALQLRPLCFNCGGSSFCRPQALGLTGFSSCGSQALEHRLSGCGAQAQVLRGMRYLPRSGIEPMSLALAGGFFTTESPGKPI